ncbi:DUF6086 family protein [Streptomyces sp. NPDC051018]|uniref:DUF6086 family protein n=1 Tax=Streptomyces sp. NPDC051018 TaxID=3365639 RepID=UPI0037B91C50
MSQYYELGDTTLWNPSNGASRLFIRQVEVFQAELGVPSGIGPQEADEYRIDPAAFGVFVNALVARHRRTSHGVVLALSEGFLATTLALAERAGIEVCWTPPPPAPGEGFRDVQVPAPAGAPLGAGDDDWADRLRRKAREMDRLMAR